MPNQVNPVNSLQINWFDGPIKQSVQSVFDGINEAVEAKDLLNKYRKAHFTSLKRSMTHLKILGMNSPVKLTDIYYPASVSTTIYRRLYEREWQSVEGDGKQDSAYRPKMRKAIILADNYIEKYDRVLILGGPGSGKTTYLRFLARAYTDKQTFSNSSLKTSKFPIFIRLPDLDKSGKIIKTYVSDKLKAKTDKFAPAFLERCFKNGFATLLLDSLDEVSDTSKREIVDQIREFGETYPNCSIVLTCRTADYEEIIEDFYEVELARLNKKAVNRIVRAWFGNEKEKARQLLRHLKHDKTVASLTENPLLLSLLCIQFRHDLRFPKLKAELYRRCVDSLLRDWDASRGFRRNTAYENLSDDRKERLFEHIALYFIERSPRYVFHEKNLLRVISDYVERFEIGPQEAEGILKEIESHHGILEKYSVDYYGFSHPSFQEYFTARCLLSRRQDLEFVKEYFKDEEWAGVIEFIVSLREDPEELIEVMMKKSHVGSLKTYPAMARRTINLWLLYRCLARGATLPSSIYNNCYNHIVISQIEIAEIYRKGGVVPFAVLMDDGVRHSYYYWNKRNTLVDALQPLRRLANTIYALPSRRYALQAMKFVKDIENKESLNSQDTSLALCLAIPLVSILPNEVMDVVKRLRKRAEEGAGTFYLSWMDESLERLEDLTT